ncbi:MAG: TonB-dependent receptor, partial [Candidatus Eremiobacteraeota bacterium]|nr:TonB-dependent receptor [Candidatus Eremiobacteraeota bacterium]
MLLRLRQRRYSVTLSLVLLSAMFAQILGFAVAGTFATISGSVSDDSGAPVAGVNVTAVSPSARYTATTDSRGYYSITGVTPDTYTVSFQHEGYDGQVASGVVAFADQTLRVNGRLNKTLRTIARVTSRSTAGAFQPGQTADTYSVNQAQMRVIQGNALNISQKNLVASLPGASYTIGQAPSIRGGRSNNVDYEIDGVPLINPYTNGNVNNYTMPTLALQSVQLSPGNEDASFGNSGVGTINASLKRGTYPGAADVIAGVGFPHFYHALAFGYGTAAPNGRWSNYLSYTTANTAPKYGGTLEQDSTLNGSYGDIQLVEDREFTNNFVYNFGKNNRFDFQYFTDNGWHKRAAGYGMGDTYNVEVTSAGGSLIVPMCYATCNPAWTSYFGDATAAGQQIYPYWCGHYPNPGQAPGPDNFRCGDWTGLSVAQFQQMTQFYPGQSSVGQTLGGRPYYQEFDENSVQKVSLDFRPDPRTFTTLTYFNTYARAVQDSISIYPFESGDVWNLQGGYYSGVNLSGTRQLSDKHLLKVGGELYHDRPVLQTVSPLTSLFNPLFNGNFEYLDFIPSGQPCPGTGTTPLPGSIFYPTYGAFSTNSCGFAYTQSQFSGSSFIAPPQAVNESRLKPDGGALFFDDTFTPNDRFKAQVGLRVDYRNNHLPPATVNADCTTTYLPLQWNVIPETFQHQVQGGNFDLSTGLFNNSAPLVYDASGNVTNGTLMGPGNCPTAVFIPVTKQESNPTIYEPRLALSYRLSNNDS